MSQKRATRRSFLEVVGAATLSSLVGVAGTGGCGGKVDEAHRPADAIPETAPVDELLKAPEALFRPTGVGCTVHWEPNGAVEARILAGPSEDELAVVYQTTSDSPTEVVIDGMLADSELYIHCMYRREGSEWVSKPIRKLRTARASGQIYRVALIADAHVYGCVQHEQRMRNLRETILKVVADRPDFAVFLGDEAGVHYLDDALGEMSLDNAMARWLQWRTTYAGLLAAVPSFMTLGNHEGEAGFYQHRQTAGCYQRWGATARKRYCLNPLATTYPEGGENDGWQDSSESDAAGNCANGNCSPLQNYYAWTWGDALFVVLDVHRYTRIGKSTPAVAEQWTLGASQMRWLERVLASSQARWKFVVAHHLVGGSKWNLSGDNPAPNYAYGRGGARYARVGEQSRVTELMKRYGARFFLYGHDHMFAHQQAEDLHFVCCGRPTFLNPRWWASSGWREAYGDVAARDPHDFYAALGYTRLTILPERVLVEYVRTGTDPEHAENVETAEGEIVHSFEVA
ncbi:MAG: metallophosphoesterase [Phycisphaerae bacterium]|nr:metallophosphoesterase [Phycisphaerae bacterium]